MKVDILKELVRNLFKKPMTIRFPDESKVIPENYRGEQDFDKSRCKGCGLCANMCPNKAIEMIDIKENGTMKKYPKIDLGKCCFCGLCQDICPESAIKLTRNIPKSTTDLRLLVIKNGKGDKDAMDRQE